MFNRAGRETTWLLDASFVLIGLSLVFIVKNLNPPVMRYEFVFATTVDCVRSNLSGISYDQQMGRFFVISNGPESVVEITPSGECLNSHPLDHFNDTEDIFHLGGDEFLIIEERKRVINQIQLAQARVVTSCQLAADSIDPNKGLEGVTYGATTQSIYLVNEDPQLIIKLARCDPRQSGAQMQIIEAFWADMLMGDYSAVTDTGDGLLILSHESNRLLKVDYQGAVKARLDLVTSDVSGQSPIQPEGVAVDGANNIYIVGEPNYLHVYRQIPADPVKSD